MAIHFIVPGQCCGFAVYRPIYSRAKENYIMGLFLQVISNTLVQTRIKDIEQMYGWYKVIYSFMAVRSERN